MLRSDIFIPTSNRYDALKNCLDSLSIQTNKNFKIYVVGIRESLEISKLVKSYDFEIDYFIQSQPGIIGAANEALAKMKSDIFIRIDDDVLISKQWHQEIINSFEIDRLVGGVTGPTIMTEEGIRSRDLTAFLHLFKSNPKFIYRIPYFIYSKIIFSGKMYEVSTFLESGAFTLGSNFESCLTINNSIEVSNLEACNWSCRRSILLEINGFDNTFLKGLGDYHEADAALRIKRLGYKLIFNPKAELSHRVEIGKVPIARPETYHRIQNFIIFYFRHYPILRSNHGYVLSITKFFLNIMLQNTYYIFKAFRTGKIYQVACIPGTFVGFLRALMDK
jgi:GT2 family glycosyltransferase